MKSDSTQDAHDGDRIEELVAELLTRLESDGPAALDEVCAQHPSRADALRSRVGWLVERGLVTPRVDQHVPQRLGPFRLMDRLGAGAMGVVFRAHDESLGRDVALKIVRPEQLFFPGARERFQNEVAAVARLQHPGIVPVHSVGEKEGLPYFAMELVGGATLAEVIEHLSLEERDLRTLDGADFVRAVAETVGADVREVSGSPLFEGPWPTVAARIVLEIAEALEHAHRRGVLHRDIKPSNVMVTPEGRVMLVDFGLARDDSGTDSTAEAGKLTKTGHVVGSLAYVAPEVLDGRAKANPRTDVWSLGVTLFELLAVDPPGGLTDPRLRAMQLAGAVAKLRGQDARISWELETILQTALEVEPERRYASAEELAHDLACALSGREIVARRAGLGLRLKRWAQRHPGRSTAAALSLLMLTVGPAVFGWQQARTNRELANKAEEVNRALAETQAQRDAARAALDRSERNFVRATEAVDLVLTEFGQHFPQELSQTEDARIRILEAALDLNQEMVQEPESDDRQTRQAIEALTRIVEIRSLLGQHAEALESVEEQSRRLEHRDGFEDEAQWRQWIAENLRMKTSLLAFLERWDQAAETGRLSVAEAERLVEDYGDEAVAQLASARLDLGAILRHVGPVEEGRAQLDRAIQELRDVTAHLPAMSDEQVLLASALMRRGSGDYAVSANVVPAAEFDLRLAALDEAVRLRESFVELASTQLQRRHLAASLLNRGTLLTGSPFADQASRDLEQAAELAAELVAEEPSVPVYRELHGAILYAYNGTTGNLSNAERCDLLETARVEFERAIELDPRPSYREKQVLVLSSLGATLCDGDSTGLGLERLEESVTVARELLDQGLLTVPTMAAVRYSAGRVADERIRLKQFARAAESAERIRSFEPPPREVALLGWHLARCAAGAYGNPDARPSERDRVEEWVERAMATLREALEVGAQPGGVAGLLSDPDLEPLEDHPSFGPFMRDLSGR